MNFSFLLMLGLMMATSVTAQVLDKATREAFRIQQQQLDRIEHERREEQLKRPRTSIEIKEPEKASKDAEKACVNIKKIIVEGAPLLGDSAREKIIAPFINQCMAVKDIEQLMAEITKYYVTTQRK